MAQQKGWLVLIVLIIFRAQAACADANYNMGFFNTKTLPCLQSAISFVQSVGTPATGGEVTTNTSLTPTSGNLLVAMVGFDSQVNGANTGTTVTVSDSLGNTWYSTPPAAAPGTAGVQIWYAMNVIGGSSDTVTATQTLPAGTSATAGTTGIDIAVTEYAGVAKTNAIDVVSQLDSGPFGNNTTASAATMTTTAACDLVVAAFVTPNGGGYTGPGTGYNSRFIDYYDTPFALYEDNIGNLVSQGISVSATAIHDNTTWGAAQASFRSTTSSGPSQTATKAVITTSAQSLSTWQCSSAVTIQLQNGSSQAVNTETSVNVALSASTATFYSDSACTYPITSTTIYGGTNSTSIYVTFPDTSNGTITATPTGFSAVSQTETLSLAQYTWIGGGSCNGNFNTTACWQGGVVPTNGALAQFDSTCTSNCNVTFNSNETASLWLHSTYSYTINEGSYSINPGAFTYNTFRQDGGTFTVTSGTMLIESTFILNGGTFNAGSSTLELEGNSNFNGGTFNAGTGTVSFPGNGSSLLFTQPGLQFNNFAMSNNGGVYVVNNFTINGNFSMSGTSGINVTNNSPTITVGGNWSNTTSGFAIGGTVLFASGASHTITGSTTFQNLTMDDSGNTAADTLTFAAGSTTGINGILTLKGNSTHDLKLRSSSSGTQWDINPSGTRSIANVDVEDSDNTNASIINVLNTGSINSGNNTNWGFVGMP